MMKTNVIKLFGFGLAASLTLASCSDDFLQDKQNYDYTGPEAYDDFTGAQLRVNDIYDKCLPSVNSDMSWRFTSSGSNDEAGKSTEEYSGFSKFLDPQNPLSVNSGTTVDDYFFGGANNVQNNTYGQIRNINDVIENIEAGSLTQEQKDELLGQCYFFRAWRYYNMVKFYGGVPIVTEVQDPVEGVENPRKTTKECIEFILDDLDRAAKMLADKTMNGTGFSGDDYGRVTTGTALALRGRVLLLWASPLFNRSNDKTRWTNAYTQMKAELDSINRCGYGLYTDGNNVNGSTFARMFNQRGMNPEAVFVTLYNSVNGDNIGRNSNWERNIRPANTSGSGKNASAMLVDMFPMADGKRPATADTYTKLSPSTYAYDSEHPFMNRDPRFYRTFAFPGFRWAYSGNATLQEDQPNSPSYNNGKDYELWNYVWYGSAEDRDNPRASSDVEYGADNLLTSHSGVYVRKRSDDLDVNSSPLYANFDAMDDNGGFTYSAQPYMEIRYAEVLLNLAEAACGAEDMAYAVSLLQQIRARAGYTAENNYGLDANLAGDQAACMSAILYERQIELAYEGKRFDDLRRWLLYDGGAHFNEIDGAPAGWTLTGWGGNTCDWLGFKPLNGQRRENMVFRVNNNHADGLGGTTYGTDPFDPSERCAAVDLREADLNSQLETLKNWYDQYLVRKLKKGDGQNQNQQDLSILFRPYYYFLGIPRGAQGNMKEVEQTIGWDDYNNGGANGTFDPLAE